MNLNPDRKYALNYAALLAALSAGVLTGRAAAFVAVAVVCLVMISQELADKLIQWLRTLEKVHEQQKKLTDDSVAYTKVLADFRQRLGMVEEAAGVFASRLGMEPGDRG